MSKFTCCTDILCGLCVTQLGGTLLTCEWLQFVFVTEKVTHNLVYLPGSFTFSWQLSFHYCFTAKTAPYCWNWYSVWGLRARI